MKSFILLEFLNLILHHLAFCVLRHTVEAFALLMQVYLLVTGYCREPQGWSLRMCDVIVFQWYWIFSKTLSFSQATNIVHSSWKLAPTMFRPSKRFCRLLLQFWCMKPLMQYSNSIFEAVSKHDMRSHPRTSVADYYKTWCEHLPHWHWPDNVCVAHCPIAMLGPHIAALQTHGKVSS